jgi:hypothetical protein
LGPAEQYRKQEELLNDSRKIAKDLYALRSNDTPDKEVKTLLRRISDSRHLRRKIRNNITRIMTLPSSSQSEKNYLEILKSELFNYQLIESAAEENQRKAQALEGKYESAKQEIRGVKHELEEIQNKKTQLISVKNALLEERKIATSTIQLSHDEIQLHKSKSSHSTEFLRSSKPLSSELFEEIAMTITSDNESNLAAAQSTCLKYLKAEIPPSLHLFNPAVSLHLSTPL